MYQILKKNIDKTKYLIALGIVVSLFLLVTVVYKSDEKIVKKSENDQKSIQTTLKHPNASSAHIELDMCSGGKFLVWSTYGSCRKSHITKSAFD